MTVTWTSGYGISEAHPFVEWGMKGSHPVHATADTVTFGRESLCGEPARSVGWRDPGFIHTAFLKNLSPEKEYYYKIAHTLHGGKVIWGKPKSFRAPPYPGQKSLQRVVIFGDMGKDERDGSNEYQNYQPASLNTTDALIRDLDNTDIVFHVGDISYANGYLSQWDQFTQQVEPITSRVPYMIARREPRARFPQQRVAVQRHGLRQGVRGAGRDHILRADGEEGQLLVLHGLRDVPVLRGGQRARLAGGHGAVQYRFLDRCLGSVDRAKQPWLVFIAHRVLGYSSGFFYGYDGAFAEPMARQSLEGLWRRHRVDVAFYGHVHQYERTCPVYEERCVPDGHGTVHVVVGGGGSHLSSFTAEAPPWSVYREMDYGFGKLTASDARSLQFEYRRSSDGKVYDSFTLHRD
ncbi:hypothetical protein VPH35_091151 [Triticum aestivum]|uniref:Purple acid phosphatase n=1 Tax=Triticum aestivum TaxID=4565 RepID=A0A3B6LPQ4_WHEAT